MVSNKLGGTVEQDSPRPTWELQLKEERGSFSKDRQKIGYWKE